MADIVKSNDAKFTVSGAESDAEPSDVGALLCTTRKRTGKDLQQIAETGPKSCRKTNSGTGLGNLARRLKMIARARSVANGLN